MWLIETEIRNRILQAEQQGLMPTAEQQADLCARIESSLSGSLPAIMSVAGNKAQIEIKGALTNAPDFFAMIFGGGNTTYPEIISALALADSDDSITDITLAVDSPGGRTDGLFETLEAISKTEKPVHAVVSNLAASAAFAIAAKADDITAHDPATRIGSIGIAVDIQVSEDIISIANSESPKKRPDVTTPEGVAVVQETLDAMHEVFARSIAEGRSAATGKTVTVDDVNSHFGQGATLMAKEAEKRGMIDAVTQSDLRVINNNKQTKKTEGKAMDLNKFKADHPAIFAEAVAAGVAQERDRVTAHLIMGRSADALDVAVEAVEAGTEMNATMQAKYFDASMKKKDVKNRDGDDTDAASALDDVSGGAVSKDAIDLAADDYCNAVGYDETGGAV